jgi:energy-coupling factor transporter ATP-binding protein EcfA2
VWTKAGALTFYPNLFVFLVGPPGVGKTVTLDMMMPLVRKSQAVTLAPNDCTKQGLLDALANCGKAVILNHIPFDFHFLDLNISELSNFMSKYDGELAGLLTALYDCPPFNDEVKRTHDKGKMIPFPGLAMIAGTATHNLGNTISDAMWGSGFMARVILVYSADKVTPEDMFAEVESHDSLAAKITVNLHRLGEMKGPLIWSPDARSAMNTFRKEAETTAPLHNRLAHYGTRRWIHLAKLAMIAALSDLRYHVEFHDLQLAHHWLTSAEEFMPEIFKDMISHEDGQIYEELRTAMWVKSQSTGRPVSAAEITSWLSSRVSVHSVQRIFAVALAADHFRRVAGTVGDDALYIPQMGGLRNLGRI